MAYPGVTFREFLDGATLQELEQYSALLQGFLQREHKQDGSHKSITGHALTLTADTDSGAAGGVSAVDGTFSGDVSVGDALAVTGTFTHDGLLNQDAVKDDPSGINSTATNWGAATLGFEMNIRVTSVAGLGPRLDGLIDPASAGTGAIGTVYRIYNDAGSAFTVKHESSLATAAAYRILCPGAVDSRIRSHGTFWLVRDETENRWRYIGERGPIVIRPAQITGDQNNYSPTGWADCDCVLLDLDAARTITGFAATFDGDAKRILNVSGFDLTISHSSASSSAGNKVICPSGAPYAVTTGGGVWLTYDSTAAFWRVTDK